MARTRTPQIGTVCAIAVAAVLTATIPRLYPWVPPKQNKMSWTAAGRTRQK
ncbi:MAG: hypothetical protein OJF52_002880 [Nitrospira sp.]|nr:MAG: hypothetical protein OJF52_002880 [Nitrospira sp.]